MTRAFIEAPNWYEALTLDERSQFAISAVLGSAGEEVLNTAEPPIDRELAQKRLQRWRAQTPFSREIYFAQRLGKNRLSEVDFVWLLGESGLRLQRRFHPAPEWINDLDRLYTQWASRHLADRERDAADLGFLFIAEPLIVDGRARFRAGVQEIALQYQHAPFDAQTVEKLFLPNLFMRLSLVASRTMVLELNVARVEGRLRGETPEARFQNFVQRLREPATALAILREYPVLARQLKLCVDYWTRNSLEFLQRLCADWAELRKCLSPTQDPGSLIELKGEAGDPHRDGRSVMIAGFASGFRLVYKPRSLSVDQHFGALLEWLNQRGEHPPFRIVRTLDRGEYGWAEFMQAQACGTPAQLRRFYERLGAFLALLHALNATDFHHENLLAVGEHPALVDLEALFHPRLNQIQSAPSLEFARHAYSCSVLRVGLLPQQIWVNADGVGLDLSGMGCAEGQQTPFTILTMDRLGTDEMRFVRKRVELGAVQNRPTLNGAPVRLDEYLDDLIIGFTQMYRLLAMRRVDLLAPDGPLAAFANDEVRVIARATKIYAQTLQESYHPNVMRSALDRDRLLDRLWVGIDHRPDLARLIPAEQTDLQKGDIPFFSSRPCSTSLWTSQGGEITDFLAESGMDLVRDNLNALSESDLSRQLWFIRGSLASMKIGAREVSVNSAVDLEEAAVATNQELLDAACAIGDRLIAASYQNENHVTWMGLQLAQEKHWSITPLGIDLYGGVSGIAFFLAYLGAMTGDEKYTRLSHKSMRAVMGQYGEARALNPRAGFSLGAFSGESGLIYLLTHLSVLWREPALLEKAEHLAIRMESGIANDEAFDILGGGAGFLSVLSVLYQSAAEPKILRIAGRCADHLLMRAEPQEQGLAWMSNSNMAAAPLTGYSHGTAGIAHALFRTTTLTGNERYLETALGAIAYERSQFLPDRGNWRDWRTTDLEHQSMVAWCHGAPGVGLARLQSLSLLDGSEIRSEIEIALETTMRRGFEGAHCLCHGALGNLEFLLEAGQILGQAQWRRIAIRNASALMADARRRGWLCATPNGVETPGLMLGLAGIGYGLLRLADPDAIPSVLTLQPPRRNQ